MVEKEVIQKARQANLAEYLISAGEPLIKNGLRYRHKEHDSLTFSRNAYYWNSRGEHGNAIDYLVNHKGMNFAAAVSALANVSAAPMSEGGGVFEFDREATSAGAERVKKYLVNSRSIARNVIEYLIENELLFQEKQSNNAIFPIYDENNIIVGAETHGTSGRSYKGVKKHSKYGYGFNVRFSEDDSFDYALFFESAIDLASFIDIKKNIERKRLERCILVSLAGVKINILRHTLKAFKGGLTTVLCVDNDEAGKNFIKEVEREKIPFIVREPKGGLKDWNEQITAMKSCRPIKRATEWHKLK
ncbi:MAG: DUF3991 and toprim domain-containing protein [Eubacterium sp.]|nr:DUF3991 and toprim domain-containing protein [Eubacterium sp.]